MNVFVLGGRGNIGQEVALGLVRQDGINKIVLGDRNSDPSGLRDRLLKNKKVSLVEVDACDRHRLTRLLRDIDVIVHCAGPFHRTVETVAMAANETKVHYVDVCDDPLAVRMLYDSGIDKAARDAEIIILTGMGSDPGTNNILARYYAGKLDHTEEIELFWVAHVAGMGGAAREHCFRMSRGEVPQFLDAALMSVEGGSGWETVAFPEPVGSCVVRYVGHPQPLTLPCAIDGLRKVTVKGAILPLRADRFIQEWKQHPVPEPAGMGADDQIPAFPEDMEMDSNHGLSGLKVVVRGLKDGKRVTWTAGMTGAMGPGTGLPVSIAVAMLGSGDIRIRGLVAPEACIDPETFLAALIQNGAVIHQRKSEESILRL